MMNDVEELILSIITNKIDSRYLESANLTVNENKGSVNSIVISLKPTIYRQIVANSVLFCRVKTNGKISYVGFSDKYETLFQKYNVPFQKAKDGFLRIDVSYFINNSENFSEILNSIFIQSFNFPAFGCCSRFKECSKEGKCVHPDIIYATACSYRKNLDNGKIFY